MTRLAHLNIFADYLPTSSLILRREHTWYCCPRDRQPEGLPPRSMC